MNFELIAQLFSLFLIVGAGPIIILLLYLRRGSL
uniref:Photosystem II reaction center protein Psb30 n=1 Tax=Microrhizoidea pickettheapsiorum TaxID=2604950 RepID=A0A5B9RFW8_9CHLO|nr:photosystem II protein psb30 [Microrhizoidea pickettheapsiorum]QEG77732.1 photosystem II protein psb30 [Microrhizoidea pickettheapsiorum]